MIEAMGKNVDLILFPEAALTGLANNDDPVHDLPLGEPIPGEFTYTLGCLARRYGVYIGIGLLEREEDHLFDTAILIDPAGEIILRYRRISPGWHGDNADPVVYRSGDGVSKVTTGFGSFAFLICGDLFTDELCDSVSNLRPDWLLFPFARSFEDGKIDKKRWHREEKWAYVERVQGIGVPTFMVNSLDDDGTFGGAMVVAASGRVVTELDIGEEGVLYFGGKDGVPNQPNQANPYSGGYH